MSLEIISPLSLWIYVFSKRSTPIWSRSRLGPSMDPAMALKYTHHGPLSIGYIFAFYATKMGSEDSGDTKVHPNWVYDPPWSFNGPCHGPTIRLTWAFILAIFLHSMQQKWDQGTLGPLIDEIVLFFKSWQTFSTRDIITNIAGVDFFQYPLTWRWRRWGWWGWPWCPWGRTSACWTTGTPCLTKVTRWGWREHMMGRSQILPSSAKPQSRWAE